MRSRVHSSVNSQSNGFKAITQTGGKVHQNRRGNLGRG